MHPKDSKQSNTVITGDQNSDEYLAELEEIEASAPISPAQTANAFADRPALLAKLVATRDELKADAYASGWTAQAWRKIDEHRKENPEEHAQNQRSKYEKKIFDATGRMPRRNRKNPTAKQRADDVAAAQKRYRDKRKPADRDADNWNRAERRRKAKEAKAAMSEDAAKAEREAMEKLPTFGIA